MDKILENMLKVMSNNNNIVKQKNYILEGFNKFQNNLRNYKQILT